MKNSEPRPHSREFSEAAGAPANEIEVTPEMIEAGMSEYNKRWCGLADADDDVAREMLMAAYLAMRRFSALTLLSMDINLSICATISVLSFTIFGVGVGTSSFRNFLLAVIS